MEQSKFGVLKFCFYLNSSLQMVGNCDGLRERERDREWCDHDMLVKTIGEAIFAI